MWSFCIYDKTRNELFLCRDRFGIKPLYYHSQNGKFVFASMISAVLCHDLDASPNAEAIGNYFAYRLVNFNEKTFFNNIFSLEPGNFIRYDLSAKSFEIKQWYYPDYEHKGEINIARLFEESVKYRTVSDVPVGTCLSGGVDSSSIVCQLDKHLKSNFKTFSLIAPGSPIDESKYIRHVGEKTNSEQFYTLIEEDDFLNDVEDFIEAQEEPTNSLAVYAQYKVMKLAHENGAKVLLDGQGGDEIFAGYIYYFSYYFYELLSQLKFIGLAKEMFWTAKNFKTFFPHGYFLFLLLPEKLKKLVLLKKECPWVNPEILAERDPRWKAATLKECLKKTLASTSIPHLLTWEDKNAMRWSVETRIPFLDVNLVEATFSLPSSKLIKNGKTKIAFKEAVKYLLPEMIRSRTDKLGFETPEVEFFRKPKIVQFCKDVIYSDSFKNRPYWDWKLIEKSYSDFLQGKNDKTQQLYQWIITELWLRKFFG
jgi:asparagine synthase (glutamine-hydrolysing)